MAAYYSICMLQNAKIFNLQTAEDILLLYIDLSLECLVPENAMSANTYFAPVSMDYKQNH